MWYSDGGEQGQRKAGKEILYIFPERYALPVGKIRKHREQKKLSIMLYAK